MNRVRAERDPLQVLVVDDSAVVRQTMSAVLSQDSRLHVATAADPLIAMEKMKRQRPDVIVLDLEMPRMDGFTFLRKLMAEDPIPVVICSGVAQRGTEAALRALDEGAVDVVAKPQLGVAEFLRDSAVMLNDAVHAAAHARVRRRGIVSPATRQVRRLEPRPVARRTTSSCVVAVGASTGGPGALRRLLQALPGNAPGCVIVQHMPHPFTAVFAQRLDDACTIEVKEASSGDEVRPGRAIVAPGDRHLKLHRNGPRYTVEVTDGKLVSRHRPSVDALFRSAAEVAGADAIGVILTGMGRDGAEGLLEMKRAGATTIAQDEQSCTIFGMPREAIALGGVDEVVPLEAVPAAILRLAPRRPRRRSGVQDPGEG